MTVRVTTGTKHFSLRRLAVAAVVGAGALTLAPTAVGTASAAPALSVAAEQVALNQVGDPYVWGAEGPDAFDCSGLVHYAYQQVGIDAPRTTGGLATFGTPVAANQLVPGDLVFLYGGGHVGIYTGNGQYVNAPTEGQSVSVVPVPWESVTLLVHPPV